MGFGFCPKTLNFSDSQLAIDEAALTQCIKAFWADLVLNH